MPVHRLHAAFELPLGGAPDAQNLWPQRYASHVWNAHVKAQLERLLPLQILATLNTGGEEWPDDGAITYPVWRRTNQPALELISFAAAR